MSAPQPLEVDRCLICDQPGFDVLVTYGEPDQYEQAVGVSPDGYWREWVRCKACGFRRSRYSRDPAVLDDIYESTYRDAQSRWASASTRETFDKIAALPEGESETKARVGWIRDRLGGLSANGTVHLETSPFRALDIGGATGIFAYEFQDSDWRMSVVDPAETGRFIEDELGIPFRQADYRAGLFEASFDLVSMVFVLEHFRDPDAALAEAAKDLNPGGLLYVEVPDALAFRLKPPEDDIFNACHLWMFDPASITRLLDRNGFEIYALERTQTLRGHYALSLLAGVERSES